MGRIAYTRGTVPDDVAHALTSAHGVSASDFCLSLAQSLSELGYEVIREVKVGERGDGRTGRVDIVASRDGLRVAIECDRKTPRMKSIVKLGRVAADVRLVVCRE